MKTRTLGPYTVSAIGLGCMPMSMNSDGNRLPDEADAIATIHAALDAGVTLLDTADVYAPSWDTFGHNETLVGKALRQYGSLPDGLVVAGSVAVREATSGRHLRAAAASMALVGCAAVLALALSPWGRMAKAWFFD